MTPERSRPRRWYELRKSDALFLLGVLATAGFFIKWFVTESPPNAMLLGAALWLATATATLPRALSEIQRRWGGPPE